MELLELPQNFVGFFFTRHRKMEKSWSDQNSSLANQVLAVLDFEVLLLDRLLVLQLYKQLFNLGVGLVFEVEVLEVVNVVNYVSAVVCLVIAYVPPSRVQVLHKPNESLVKNVDFAI